MSPSSATVCWCASGSLKVPHQRTPETVEVHVNQQLFHWHRQLLDSAHATEICQMTDASNVEDLWLDVPDPG